MIEQSNVQAAIRKATDWLISQQLPDGSLAPQDELLMFAYKVPWSFAVSGSATESEKLLSWIVTHQLPTLGDFYGRYPFGVGEGEYLYQAAWLVCGAHQVGRYDLSQPSIDFLLSFQDAQSGGVYAHRNKMGPDGEQNAWISAMVGLAALMTGRVEAAQRIGEFLVQMRALQPDFNKNFQMTYTTASGLVTDYLPGESLLYAIDCEWPGDQFYFAPGLISTFLAGLYLAQKDETWLELAQDFLAFAGRCPPGMFQSVRCGKVGWGAACLFQITQSEQLAQIARRVAAYLVQAQQKEGFWTVQMDGWPERHAKVDITAEFVVILNRILQSGSIH